MIYKDEAYQIIGAAMEVHKELGCGFLESLYQEAFALELTERGIMFEREKSFEPSYKGVKLGIYYKADFVCFDKIIVELKAVNSLLQQHELQVLNYLNISGMQLGLLINFGQPSLEFKRIIKTISGFDE